MRVDTDAPLNSAAPPERRRRLDVGVALLVAVLSAEACGDSSRPLVTEAEYGAAWPLTVPEGRLQCDTQGPRKLVTLDVGNGIHYGLNGSAIGFGFPDGRDRLKPGRLPTDLQPLITRGLALCP